MEPQKKTAITSVAAAVLCTLSLLAIIGLIIVYTGAFNVAATEQHMSLTRWAFDTTLRNSVDRRAADVAAPERFTTQMVAAGASEYKATCQHCHAGPGVERAEWASGMRPQPPHLMEAAAKWEPTEVFWLVKHGIRMTGMPAFGPRHTDETIWNIVAFVTELPAMTPERYAAFESEGHHGGSAN